MNIQVKRGIEANLGSITLADGEFAITTDTKKLYVGIAGSKVCLGGASSLGDMIKSVYDTNNDGIVDNSDKLDGKHASEFALTSHGNHVPTTQTANNSTFLRNDNTWQNVTPENIGANKLTYSYKHTEGTGNINYSKVFTATITGNYADIAECFVISCRSLVIAYVMVTANTGNSKKISTISVDVFPLTPNASSLATYFKAGVIAVDATTDQLELWMKMNAWDECHIYPQTSMRRVYSIAYYNGSTNTAFPTTFTSYADSKLLASNASSIKGPLIWNDLKGV